MAIALFVPLALSAASASVSVGECRVMRVARTAGAVVSESDALAYPCPRYKVAAKLRYDTRRRVSVAREALAEGDALGRVYLPPPPDVLPGDRIELAAHIGHVVVSRLATALQVARASERFFVRGGDGRVVAAPRLATEVKR